MHFLHIYPNAVYSVSINKVLKELFGACLTFYEAKFFSSRFMIISEQELIIKKLKPMAFWNNVTILVLNLNI